MPYDSVAAELSLQEFNPPTTGLQTLLLWNDTPRSALLPDWSSVDARALKLRWLSRLFVDTLAGQASAGFIKKIQSTPHEVKGDKPQIVKRFQEMFQNAQYGAGWDAFIPLLISDYLYQDKGAFIYLIGRGDPAKPIKGPVLGIAVLDSVRCTLTGSPEYPVIYQAKDGKFYRIENTRIIHIVDSPDPDEDRNGVGHCYLSRVASIGTVDRLMEQYSIERLGDLPPAGILAVSGITDKQYQDAVSKYHAANSQDGADHVWKNVIRVTGIDPDKPVKVELTPFSTLPEHFDYEKAINTHVNMIALALGVDKQEIWELSSGSLGSGAQSQILDKKSEGKGYGHLLQMLERKFNTCILPEELEFRFKFKDSEQDADDAERAQVWASIASSVPGLSDLQRLQLLANNVPQFADVLLDEKGQVKLEDADVKPVDDTAEVAADDATTQGVDGTAPATTAPDDAALASGGGGKQPAAKSGGERVYGRKALQSTRLDFEGDLEELLNSAVEGTTARARAGIILRALISKYGRRAYEDGLSDGGVKAPPTNSELSEINGMVRDQSAYVTGMMDALYQDGLTETEIQGKPDMWFRGSILNFYHQGLLASGDDPLMKFSGSDGAESCPDCKRLKGQVHRLSEYIERNYVPKPGADFECGGYNCEHGLVRATGEAKGNW